MKTKLIVIFACITASCSSRDNMSSKKSPEQAEFDKANALAAQLKEGMTFENVSNIIHVGPEFEVPVREHGGNWYDVPVGRYYHIQLRFEHYLDETNYSKVRLNLPPNITHVFFVR